MATKTRTTRPTTTDYKVQTVFTQAEVLALLAQLTGVSQEAPKPQVKAKPAPKARKKATPAQIAEYKTLWKARVALRKSLGLASWAEDKTSRNAEMVKIVAKMDALTAKGVKIGDVKW